MEAKSFEKSNVFQKHWIIHRQTQCIPIMTMVSYSIEEEKSYPNLGCPKGRVNYTQ